MCGENPARAAAKASSSGSSPRVRGKRPPGHPHTGRAGLIPACAGKTARVGCRAASWGAHPRVCGENHTITWTVDAMIGSSPRVRGKLGGHAEQFAHEGLIPACAGKTWTMLAGRFASPAHPRVCGENHEKKIPDALAEGSSPRVRGKLHRRKRHAQHVRLIPARAGKTGPGLVGPVEGRAHPRACGENQQVLLTGLPKWGSSPRVRGKQAPCGSGEHPPRLIPARAGKTGNVTAYSAVWPAHPRACGEKVKPVWDALMAAGSSPRVRGKPTDGGGAPDAGRLIPARAGKTTTPAGKPA